MTSSQPNKPADERITVSLSLKRSLVKKLNRKAKLESNDDAMTSRSRVAERLLEEALR